MYDLRILFKNTIYFNEKSHKFTLILQIASKFVNPTILYPRLHRGMHFNEKSYKFIADKITNNLNK